MKSRSKTEVTFALASEMMKKAGLGAAVSVEPLGAGEFNTVLAVTTESGKTYALKVAPSADADVQLYEKDMMRSEVHWYSLMRERTDIPVPEVFYADFSRELLPADWFVMSMIEGRHPGGEKEKEAQALTEQLARMAASMHKVKGEGFGYIQRGLHPTWHDAVRAMTEDLLRDAEKKGVRSRRGEKLLRLIDRYADTLNEAEGRMVNYDIWTPNIIVQETAQGKKFWWIDPERSFWGDPVADFVCLEFFKPFRKKTLSAKAYNECADLPVTLSRGEEIRWGVMMAYMGLLQEVEKHYRYTPMMFGWWRNVLSSALVYRAGFKALKK